MGRKKSQAEEGEVIVIADDQVEVQNHEGEAIVIARANLSDHKRLGWIEVE